MDIKVEETENVKSLSEVTADTIVQHIINEGLGKGDKLPNEKILCELLGVGRSTLGVSQDPLGFTFVKDKKRLIHDLVEFRMMLEPRVAALAAQNRTKEQLAKLEAQAAVVDELISQGKSHAQADSVFHSLLGEMSGNSVLPNLEPIIFKAIDLFIDLSQSKLSHDTIGEHRAIVEAIKAGKSVDASDAMIAHLLNNKNYIMKVLEHENF